MFASPGLQSGLQRDACTTNSSTITRILPWLLQVVIKLLQVVIMMLAEIEFVGACDISLSTASSAVLRLISHLYSHAHAK